MHFQQSLLDLSDLFNFSDLSAFTQNIPVEWVESALQLSAQASIRRRRLPSDQVLWLVLGMALFRDEPIHEVVRRLNICAQGLASSDLLARSGISEARQRLGAEPVEWLFRKTGHHWGRERYNGDDWHGLQVLAVDGALLRTPDSPELREHFGSGNTATERQTPFPMLRLVALMNVRSHIVMDARISPYRRGEIPLAADFANGIPDHSITLFDKGFWSADLLLSLQQEGQERHWLIPARKGLVAEEIHRNNAHDRELRMKVSPQARKRNPTLPEFWTVREVTYESRGKLKTVYTSLPFKRYRTDAVAKLYQERWEIELGFRDIKSSMQGNAITLRSKKVDLIYQEVWGMLLTYNIIRRESAQAAVAFGLSPSDMSFKHACKYIAVQLIVMADAQPISRTGKRLSELRSGVSGLVLRRRPRRSTPRTVKISKTRYPVDRNAAPLK
ncbi:MAG: IS4 family transposase [Oceanospirillaceae bacterium]|uniref:IS4 family transposase n=1 Tax=unclassified Thalassolituus TaxID=2624967 RepID=UPI000C68B47D|nr:MULTISPECIES: IS4 family transposase [unclassified Thalassolituus]MAG42870.1 IS4 family transposase [Oceanospirillaceae bacterium]MCS5585063.1 IS4 family transposase [Pseudomonadales bacterium]MEC9255739.1 IS4 family transposase [Pseudomonadota bacterium]HCG80334.1 IS4 family transposase [Oceanospirillales bacterium]MAX87733.1 IS4 family transposase [Oceanospirillaceae bacterium]